MGCYAGAELTQRLASWRSRRDAKDKTRIWRRHSHANASRRVQTAQRPIGADPAVGRRPWQQRALIRGLGNPDRLRGLRRGQALLLQDGNRCRAIERAPLRIFKNRNIKPPDLGGLCAVRQPAHGSIRAQFADARALAGRGLARPSRPFLMAWAIPAGVSTTLTPAASNRCRLPL